jgi:hypothetical protein
MPVSLPPEYQGQQASVDRRRKLAEALQAQAMAPLQARQAGQFMVAPSPLEGVAKLAQALSAHHQQGKADESQLALGQKVTADRQTRLAQALQTAQGSPQPAAELGGGPAMPGNPMGAYAQLAGSGDPTLMQAGGNMMNLQAQEAARTQAQTHQAQQAQLQREATAAQQQANRDAASSRATESNATRELIAGMVQAGRPAPTPVKVKGKDGRPQFVTPEQAIGMEAWSERSGGQLPPAILKEQNELIEGIGIAESLKADLTALDGQLSSGELNVGPVSNLWNSARNATGFSNQESVNFNSFKTTLERMRNDSLRLNKGVQTEGDAQRVWNELMGNINDPQVVRQRLGEIQRINQRAADLKRVQIAQLRQNFNVGDLDAPALSNQPAVVGGQQYAGPERRKAQNMPSGITVKRIQ